MRRQLLPMLIAGITCLLAACFASLHDRYARPGAGGGFGVPGDVAACTLVGVALLVWFYALLWRTDRALAARTLALVETNAALEQRVREVSDASATARALRASEAAFRTMFEIAAVGKCEADCATGRFIRVNRKMCEITGYDEAELLAMTTQQLTHPDDRAASDSLRRRFLGEDLVEYTLEKRYVRKDGRVVWVENCVRNASPAGEPPRLLAVVQDVTARRAAADALRAGAARLRAIITSMDELLFEFDADGRCVEVHVPEERLYGIPRAAIVGRRPHEYLDAVGADAFMTAFRRVVAEGRARTVEYPLVLPAGRRWFLSRINPVQPEDGGVTHYCVLATDITQRKAAEDALAESERFARSVVDALLKHIAILDESGRIIAVNRAWRLFGSANGCAGEGRCDEGADYLAVCDAAAAAGDSGAAAAAAGIRDVLARRRGQFEMEYPCHSPGEQRWFVMRVTRFAGDGPVRVVVSHENVTQRRLAEERLRFQKALLEAQSEASVDGILICSCDGRILSHNRRFAEMWDVPAAVLAGGDDAAAMACVRDRLADPEPFLARVRYLYEHLEETARDEVLMKDGRVFDRYSAAIRLDGAVVGRVWYFRDVTEQRRAAEVERDRLALRDAVRGMDQVLGVVGHELRTPLAGLRAISEFLLTDAARGTAEFDQFLKGLNEEVVRMSETVNNLLEAARLNSGRAKWNFRDFYLEQACRDALDAIRPLIDESKLSLNWDVEPSGVRMHGDPDAVRRLIINLATNSRRHTSQGSIRVEIAGRSDDEGDWIDLRVTDTGAGIPPEILKRLGEAFALNSGVVGANHVAGTGLGIAICTAIVTAHGGRLAVESQVGRGTTVTASLRADLPGPVVNETPEVIRPLTTAVGAAPVISTN